MKPPSIAPAYAFLYPILCGAAREKGYALAMHGTIQRDLDLIAVPWTVEAASADELVQNIKAACDGWIFKAADNLEEDHTSPKRKPHGRMAWLIYITHDFYIDLSVMPRLLNSDI